MMQRRQLRFVGIISLSLLALATAACRTELPNAGEFADPIGTTGTSVGVEGTSVSTSISSGTGEQATDGTGSSGGTRGGASDSGSGSGGVEVCGDGVVEGAEECDDAGQSMQCDDDCTVVACGDEVVNGLAGEECDEGGATAQCDDDCTFVVCGDEVVNGIAGEECDGGGLTAQCDDDCTLASCGDHRVNDAAGEDCDEGEETATCDINCTFVACGDGHANGVAGEECDDGGKSATCDVDCTVAWCGDGLTNALALEDCDDAGLTAACDGDCTLRECGDGYLNESGGEECDDGGESLLCNIDCTMASCGDGLTNATAGEECDDAGESAVCDDDCTAVVCGDGNLNETFGEQCDEGGESNACDVDCTPPECGDAVLNMSVGEQCDEGGATPLCDADCTLAGCGDGLVNEMAGEACDDLGESATCNLDCSPAGCGDGISNVTAGESCDDLGPSLSCDADCTPVECGDGVTNAVAGEDCDDAGESVECDADCTSMVCGDGTINVAAGEQCEAGDLGGETCVLQGFDYGTLDCGPACAYDMSGCEDLPGIPLLTLGFSQVKRFEFNWGAVAGAEYYQLLESLGPGEPFVQLGGDVVGEVLSVEMPLHLRWQASYVLRACNVAGCTESAVVDVVGSLAEAVGYVKASNTGVGDNFGFRVAVSGDASTLAVGAILEDSNATGIGGSQANDSVLDSGAVYVFVRDGLGSWSQQAYVKASNTDAIDRFGASVALSGDGNTLAVGALEDSNATGIGGNQADNSARESGAVYVFVRDGLGTWSQQAYIKASNTGVEDQFGVSVSLSGDGNALAVGAYLEDSTATGIGGNQDFDDDTGDCGAVYVFVRDGLGVWSQQAYVKASNTGIEDRFGESVALSGDGHTLAVGATEEDSNATGIGGNQANNSAPYSGAVYVFVRDGLGSWSQQAYVKASNTELGDYFGWRVALSGDGHTLAVSAVGESSGATGIGGNQADNSASSSGAVYVFVRDGLGAWSQQAYIKASNTGAQDEFGASVALSGDGHTLVVAGVEASNATGIGGNEVDDSASHSGAVYVFVRDGLGAWSQRAYVKASNTGVHDYFGWSVAVSGDGSALAVGAWDEDSNATGIGGDQLNENATNSGAVYLY